MTRKLLKEITIYCSRQRTDIGGWRVVHGDSPYKSLLSLSLTAITYIADGPRVVLNYLYPNRYPVKVPSLSLTTTTYIADGLRVVLNYLYLNRYPVNVPPLFYYLLSIRILIEEEEEEE